MELILKRADLGVGCGLWGVVGALYISRKSLNFLCDFNFELSRATFDCNCRQIPASEHVGINVGRDRLSTCLTSPYMYIASVSSLDLR